MTRKIITWCDLWQTYNIGLPKSFNAAFPSLVHLVVFDSNLTMSSQQKICRLGIIDRTVQHIWKAQNNESICQTTAIWEYFKATIFILQFFKNRSCQIKSERRWDAERRVHANRLIDCPETLQFQYFKKKNLDSLQFHIYYSRRGNKSIQLPDSANIMWRTPVEVSWEYISLPPTVFTSCKYTGCTFLELQYIFTLTFYLVHTVLIQLQLCLSNILQGLW